MSTHLARSSEPIPASQADRPRRGPRSGGVFGALARIPLVVWSVVVIYPIVWMFIGAFKTNAEIFRSPWALPEDPMLDNFVRAWADYGVGAGLMNSGLITVLGTLLTLTFGLPAAYALARVPFRGARLLYNAFLVSLTIPTVLGLIPLFFLLLDLKLLNNLPALAVVYAASRLPFTIFLLSGFMHAIPRELEEAAAIDGTSRYRLLSSIITPIMRPALITMAVMNAVTFWNEYIMALIFLPRAESRTIGVVLDYMNQNAQYSNDWGGLFAALSLSVIPVLIVYTLLQKQIIRGMLDGAMKD
ncbi:MAG: carbohydrate ABC transporter permease [Propionibacteriaceae bacterium]|nr:carbohydrate ABC transporter permease [Propionibacteriaceae bacterium]